MSMAMLPACRPKRYRGQRLPRHRHLLTVQRLNWRHHHPHHHHHYRQSQRQSQRPNRKSIPNWMPNQSQKFAPSDPSPRPKNQNHPCPNQNPPSPCRNPHPPPRALPNPKREYDHQPQPHRPPNRTTRTNPHSISNIKTRHWPVNSISINSWFICWNVRDWRGGRSVGRLARVWESWRAFGGVWRGWLLILWGRWWRIYRVVLLVVVTVW